MILQIIYDNDVYTMFQLKDDKKQIKVAEELVKLIRGTKFQDNKIYCPNIHCAKLVAAYYRSEINDR